ncbi:MAG TPA: hypothetical protein VKP65_22525 [Rhodothermales bacterium]|nr:hypothetical protein [Rhodothermales bacterium]
MPTVIVSGALANKPRNGGEAWVRLGWVRGLKQLGLRVYLIEQISRETCVDDNGKVVPFEECINLAFFNQVTSAFDLSDTAALIYEGGEQVYGMTKGALANLAKEADLLVNISGHLTLDFLLQSISRTAYIDIDPGFTQFWHHSGEACLREHDYYFTIGENIGTSACTIPTDGIRWRPTRQPVVLADWPMVAPQPFSRFTTVANWRGPYGTVVYGGQTFGLKVHEFRKFIELPQRAGAHFEIALNIHPADHKDRAALQQRGWHLTDPQEVAADPLAFRRYVQGSGAEFSVAQGIYVDTNSGWFSDRSVRYLASGKPVLVQDTGFSRQYPTGTGLVGFLTVEEAAAGVQSIMQDYAMHSQAARALAETYFDSDQVLGQLLNEVGL